MPSSGMVRHAALVRTDVSEEHIASIIRVTKINELETLAVTSIRSTLQRDIMVTANVLPSSPIPVTLMTVAMCSSETSVLTRARWHNVTEDGILHSHCHENLKYYIALTG
jgi:hypothetical protein